MKVELFWKTIQFLKYYFRAKLPNKISDPEILNLLKNFLNLNQRKTIYNEIENLRVSAGQDNSKIDFYELGAKRQFKRSKRIKDILSKSVSPKQKCELLQNISKKAGEGVIVEIGTSLGFVSAYLAIGNSEKSVFTFEGNPTIVDFANRMHKNLNINNVFIVNGDFEDTLDKNLSKINLISFAFIDGNHQENATIRYFEKVLKKCNEDSIIVLDDIYWSKAMNQAWNKIKRYEQVSASIDLFQIGIVFLKSSLHGNFTVIKSRIDPFF